MAMATNVGSSPDLPVSLPLQGSFGKPDPSALPFNVKNVTGVLARVNFQTLPNVVLELGLENDLGEIEAAPVPDQARRRLAEKWLQRYPGVASWEALATALRSPIVGENRLANELEKWCLRRDSGTSTLSSSSGPYSPHSLTSPFTMEEKGSFIISCSQLLPDASYMDQLQPECGQCQKYAYKTASVVW